MNCEQAKPLIEPYADGELDIARVLELEQHLRDCPACAPAWRNLQSLKKAVRQDALLFTAPAELERRLKAELRLQAKGRIEKKFWNRNWLTAATTGLAAVCLALLFAVTLTRTSPEPLEHEIVSSHIRSLLANHALDVASTDQHTVKPWFDGKLDFAPPVKDLAPRGFPLMGGRLDYVGGHEVAALVFQCHKHVINLFIWPANPAELKPTPEPPLQGYNVIHWSRAEMSLWAVSDLNLTELMQFAQAFDSGGP
jgi:anti-sigma factor RsiW